MKFIKKNLIVSMLLILVFLLIIIFASPVYAAIEVVATSSGGSDIAIGVSYIGQSFTPTKSGTITSISMEIGNNKPQERKVQMLLFNVDPDTGLPAGDILSIAEVTLNRNAAIAQVSFDFTSGIRSVSENTKYAFMVMMLDNDNRIVDNGINHKFNFAGDPYAGGTMLTFSYVPGVGYCYGIVPSADLNFSVSADINKDSSISAVSGSGVYGGNITLTATLKTPDASGTPLMGKLVHFNVGGVYLGSAITNASGVAKLTAPPSAPYSDVGTFLYAVNAVFDGDDSFNGNSASGDLIITAKPLSVTAAGVNKEYDRTTVAAVTLNTNKLAGDEVTVDYTSASFQDKNVGNGKTVNVTGIFISGADAYKYILQNTMASTSADITAKPLLVTAVGFNKIYDGTNTATIALAHNGYMLDTVFASCTSATFNTKNIGTGKPISVVGLAISGVDAGNYALQNTTAATAANITSRNLFVTASGIDKIYDGTRDAAVNLDTDKVAGDDVTALYTSAEFYTKNASYPSYMNVYVYGLSITGADAGNYTLMSTYTTTTARINKKLLTVTVTGNNKVYDGTTVATVNFSHDAFNHDLVNVGETTTSRFTDKNVGTDKTVWVIGFYVYGLDANNYYLEYSTTTTTADITQKPLTATAAADSKEYDGTTDATGTINLAEVVSGDTVTASATFTFDNKNVGIGKAVNVTGITLSGADAGNYSVNTTASASADITARELVLSNFHVTDKIWDSTTEVYDSGFDDNRINDDELEFNYDVAFEDPNVGTSKTVYFTNITISGGADRYNYNLVTISGTSTANINLRPTTLLYNGVLTGQYSDPAGLSVILTDTIGGNGLYGKTIDFTLNVQSISGTTNFSGISDPELILNQAPGPKTLTVSFSGDGHYAACSPLTLTYVVAQEDAMAYYTGPLFLNTVSTASGSATIQLRATVLDITLMTGNPLWDNYTGDIRNAMVTFYNNSIAIASVPLQLIDPLNSGAATASYDWTVDIGNSNSESFEVKVVVSGWYTGETETDIITVSKPLASEFITGGGYLITNNSAGQYAASAGSKTNFGFSVKYNKAGKKLQGQVNIIFRKDGRAYQIKANAFQSLTVDQDEGTAAFFSKANLQDVTDPSNPVSLDGNHNLELRLTDGDPVGNKKSVEPDTIGIALWTTGGQLLYSSNWNGITVVEQELFGGNVIVR